MIIQNYYTPFVAEFSYLQILSIQKKVWCTVKDRLCGPVKDNQSLRAQKSNMHALCLKTSV